MPHHGLECLGVRRDVFGIDGRHDHARVRSLRGVASIAAHYANHLRADRLGMLERHYQIRANILFEISAADREDEERVAWCEPAYLEPFDEHCCPALVIRARRKFRYVVGRRVTLDPDDLAKVIDGVRAITGTATHAEKKHTTTFLFYADKNVGDRLDGIDVHSGNDFGRLPQMLRGVACMVSTHQASPSRMDADG